MNENKLAKLRGELARRRRSPQKAVDLISLAESLGRKRVNRGKEPTWESQHFQLTPLSIPVHKGRDLSPRVRNIVLDALAEDVLCWGDELGDGLNDDEEDNEED